MRTRSVILLVLLVTLAFLGNAWLIVQPCLSADYTGKVVGVIDGDTIEVLNGHHAERIRLSGIDCPEKGQAFGTGAKQALSTLVFERDVVLQTHGQDRYKRTLADVFLRDGTHVNHELIREGWCWWYRKYAPKDLTLKQYEETASREEGNMGG